MNKSNGYLPLLGLELILVSYTVEITASGESRTPGAGFALLILRQG